MNGLNLRRKETTYGIKVYCYHGLNRLYWSRFWGKKKKTNGNLLLVSEFTNFRSLHLIPGWWLELVLWPCLLWFHYKLLEQVVPCERLRNQVLRVLVGKHDRDFHTFERDMAFILIINPLCYIIALSSNRKLFRSGYVSSWLSGGDVPILSLYFSFYKSISLIIINTKYPSPFHENVILFIFFNF